MPVLSWHEVPLPRYEERPVPELGWREGITALKSPLAKPQALETKLDREDRERWRGVLEALERYDDLAEEALLVVTMPSSTEPCAVPASWTPPLLWRLAAHQLGQQQRNVLWTLGRLELARRSFDRSVENTKEAFGSDRLRHADEPLLAPLGAMRAQLMGLGEAAVLDGDWLHARFLARFARHRPAHELMLQIEEALLAWQASCERDARWSYAASSARAPVEAVRAWLGEHEALVDAADDYVEQAKSAERLLSQYGLDGDAERCATQHVKRLSLSASALALALHMQVELATAQSGLRALLREHDDDEVGKPMQDLAESIASHQLALSAFEKAALSRLDEANAAVWADFPDVLDPASFPARPRHDSADAWRAAFEARRKLPALRVVPEPEQGLRRGKPKPPFVSEVLDLVRSPSRIAEVEQGLLAISEIDVHLTRMHEAFAQACGELGCVDIPSPKVADSPRSSEWIKQWSTLPVAERTLGHNVLVLELTQLHLARQLQRLADMHAWFAERSSANLAWPRLDAWQRTWTLQASRGGSYLGFLRAMSNLTFQVRDFAIPAPARPCSAEMMALLQRQAELFELTVDYARFIDRGGGPPVPIESLLGAWNELHGQIARIEAATLERDAKAAEAAGTPPP